jgi:hypothetical protein
MASFSQRKNSPKQTSRSPPREPLTSHTQRTQRTQHAPRPQRAPNDGMSRDKAMRICIHCFAGNCKTTDNDLLHLVHPDIDLDPSMVNFLVSNEGTQDSKPWPKQHIISREMDASSTSDVIKLPCRYCPIGKCKNYSIDQQFQHISGWFVPLSRKQLADLKNVHRALVTEQMYEQKESYEDQIKQLAKYKNELDLLKAAMAGSIIGQPVLSDTEQVVVPTDDRKMSLQELLQIGKNLPDDGA